MRKLVSLSLLLISFALDAQRKDVLPDTPFNATDAKSRLAYGTATIKGIAVTREYTDANRGRNPLNSFLGADVTGTKHLAPPGTVVLLFPVTDYFKKYYQLRKKYRKSRKYVAVLSTEAFSYRIETVVGKNGEFTFERMKPGEYYIEAVFNYRGTGLGYEQVGRTDYYNGYGHYKGSDPIYKSYHYDYTGSAVESAFVTISKDGEIKNVKL